MDKKIKLRTYKDLIAWQRAYQLCLLTYQTVRTFPRTEQFGLTSQLKRSALSIPSNIAEGYTRYSRPEYLRFLYISYASLAELETQLLIVKDLNFINQITFDKIMEIQHETQRILQALIKSLQGNRASL